MIETLLTTALPRDASCTAAARRAVEFAAGHLLTEEGLDDVRLVASELAANAYRHGEGRIELHLHHRDDRILVEVIDEGSGKAVEIREAGTEAGGWGLKLVDRVTERWGAYEGTTHVWAEVAIR